MRNLFWGTILYLFCTNLFFAQSPESTLFYPAVKALSGAEAGLPDSALQADCDKTFVQSLTGMGGSRPGIFPHPDGGFFATGLRNDSTVLIRFDQNDLPLWARAFRLGADVVQIRDMYVDISGDLIGVAYHEVFNQSDLRSTVFRYDPASHAFAWVQHLPNVQITQIHALTTPDCALTGTTSGGTTYLARFDVNTGALTGYNQGGDSGDYYSSLYNGMLFGACRRYYDGFQAAVFAHDLQTGNLLWQKTIISNGDQTSPTTTRMYPVKPVAEDDGVAVLASGDLQGFNVYFDGPVELVLAKTSHAGDVAWTKQYEINGYDRPLATAVVSTEDGYYLVANLYRPQLSDFAFTALIKTDRQGNLQWARRLGISGRNIARTVMERDGFLYLTVASDSYAFNDLLLIKLDQQGITNADCGFIQPITVYVKDLPNVQNIRSYSVYDAGIYPSPRSALSNPAGIQTKTYCSTPCPCPEQPDTAFITLNRCANDPIEVNGELINTDQTFIQYLLNIHGCDSVVITYLKFIPLPTRMEAISFCPGETIVIGGNAYTQPGTVTDTIPATGPGCDTVATYVLEFITPAPSFIALKCPEAVNVAISPGAGPTVAHYTLPDVDSDCPCPGLSLSLSSGLSSGSAFPPGVNTVCFAAQDSCGNSASCCFSVIIREEQACDIKEPGCLKYELLTITADPDKNLTYRIRVTNNCPNPMIYTAIQLPKGVTALEPAQLAVYEAESSRKYEVRNPNYSPFYSVRFKSTTDSVANGQSDIFQYTLPAQTSPAYIQIASRLAPQIFQEAHLNTFYCPIGITPAGNKVENRSLYDHSDQISARLFPNPTTGNLWIDLPQWTGKTAQIRLFDTQGRMLREQAAIIGEMPVSLNITERLPNGLYLLELRAVSGERLTLKFVLER